MKYQFAQERPNFSDFASGKVFYSAPGHPPFPIRLASEIFQRCLAIRTAHGLTTPCRLYDPCCGAAYHLSILAYLHWPAIREIIGSDIDSKAVSLAEKNLGLLGLDGLDQRIAEINEMLRRYGKESHQVALESASRLRSRLVDLVRIQPMATQVFQADATDRQALRSRLKDKAVDMVFADIPYGQHSQWQLLGSDPTILASPAYFMLDALAGILPAGSIVALVSDKRQKVQHEKYQRLEQFQLGKRRVAILKPAGEQGSRGAL